VSSIPGALDIPTRIASKSQQTEDPNALTLLLAVLELRDALRHINERVHAKFSQPPDGTRLDALAKANRALAEAESRVSMPVRQRSYVDCPRCQGEGQITERGVLLRRSRCPDCDGCGCVVRSAPVSPVLPRGRRQRLILTRLLALGGAIWPVPLKRLWAGQSRSRADHAARSRTVRTLEQRGLVPRKRRTCS
jgi:hypothetical protein